MKKLIIIMSLFVAALTCSGCGTIGVTGNYVDPVTGVSRGPALIDNATGKPLATVADAATAATGGPAGLIGWGLSTLLGIGMACLSKKFGKTTAALDETSTAIEHLKNVAPEAWDKLKPLLQTQLTVTTEQLIDKIQER
jgi:hypothetical protein